MLRRSEQVLQARSAGLVDRFLPIRGADALQCARDLARKEGIFCGISARATFAGALEVARTATRGAKTGDVFVPKTVVLELEWVLRCLADQPKIKVIECLAHLIALPGITVEDRDEIEVALSHCRNGIDFADAMHLAASKAYRELLTFDDRGYARRARKLRLKPPVQMPTR